MLLSLLSLLLTTSRTFCRSFSCALFVLCPLLPAAFDVLQEGQGSGQDEGIISLANWASEQVSAANFAAVFMS